jgi:Ca2+-transporting ATPase
MQVDGSAPSPAPSSSGLTTAEAARRLSTFGANELPKAPRRHVARILFDVLREPMFLLLALAAAVYLVVGGIGEGMLMAGFAALSILLVVMQERRSENALDALRSLAAPMARVLRDGREQRIAAREVVPGDWLLVADGERVAADVRLRVAENLTADESLLTGESVPVAKHATAGPAAIGTEDEVVLYAGTLVVSGRGMAEVVTTGVATEAGRIGASLASIDTEPTLLQKSFARLVRLFATLALGASGLVFLLYGLGRGQWLQGVLSGIAFAMSMLPEEFPMVMVVFVALGAHRLARLHVLARRTAVIEVLGACSTLCLDKTGTLTENRMRVCGLDVSGRTLEVDDHTELAAPFAKVMQSAAYASSRSSNDPMDAALHRLMALNHGDSAPTDARLEREYGLTAERPAVIRLWRGHDGALRAFAKGAPEAIADLCRISAASRDDLLRSVESQANRGRRVLAIATGTVLSDATPDNPAELDLHLEGLVAFADPVRPTAAAAIAEARNAGITVVMITGDHPATALAIARQAGIDCDEPPITGAQIDRLGESELRQMIRTARIFARVRPHQKLRLVEAFKANGEIVAMTGDGVNDAPALKAAHVGLAMGKRGTDVAREAASIVLMEDDLHHLLAGIEMGRRIFDNLRKASIYIVAIHIPIAGLALLPLLLGLPPLLLPLHVVLIEMVVDPICAIAFENEPVEANSMRQPPRNPADPPIGTAQLGVAVVLGTALLAATLGLFAFGLSTGDSVEVARTLAFIAMTAGNLALVRVAGTRGTALSVLFARGYRAYWLVAAVAGTVTASCITVPVLRRLFQFGVPAWPQVVWAAAIGIGAVLIFDLAKASPAVQKIWSASAPRSAADLPPAGEFQKKAR